jgi:hypothetical protein
MGPTPALMAKTEPPRSVRNHLVRVGNVVIAVGAGVVLVGIMIRLGWFSWFGHLPGDIRSEGGRGGFYFPITSSVVISVVGTIVVNVLARWLRS